MPGSLAKRSAKLIAFRFEKIKTCPTTSGDTVGRSVRDPVFDKILLDLPR
jgi:hypothetical protein